MERKIDYTQLIIRFFEKTIDDHDLPLLTEWLKVSQENRKLFDEYNESYQLADITAKSWLYNPEDNWDVLSKRICKTSVQPSVKMVISRQLWAWRVAASIALLIAFSFSVLFFSINQSTIYENQVVKVITPRGEKSKIILQDGSSVWLNSGSELTYKYDHSTHRRIAELNGEGFFEVSKDIDVPFIVRTSKVEVLVHGTRFNVSAYGNDDFVETTLEEGSISLKVIGTDNEVVVEPGQQFIYDKFSGDLKMNVVETELFTSWKENKLKFDNVSFTDLVKKLERWYGVDIHLEDQFHYSERYTMTLKTESLREVLSRIQLTTPINFSIEEDEVSISGRN